MEGLCAERKDPEEEGLEIKERKIGKGREQSFEVDGRDVKH